jgi:glycopeptide antibiotics resistance protein
MPINHIPFGPIRYVSEGAVLLPLFIAAVLVMLWRLDRGRRRTWARAAAGLIACVYLVGVVKKVLLPLPLNGNAIGGGVPWHDYINLTPFQNTDVGDDMAPNVLLFVPLGVLLPLLARVRPAWRATLIGLLVSVSVETVQFVTDVTLRAGHAADINDVISNTAGALLGFLLLRLALRLPPAARLAEAVAWPDPAPPSRPSPVRPPARRTELATAGDRSEHP